MRTLFLRGGFALGLSAVFFGLAALAVRRPAPPSPAGVDAETIRRASMFDAGVAWKFGSAGRHLLRTTDGGQTWREVTPPRLASGGSITNYGVELYPFDARTAWVTESGYTIPTIGAYGVERTTDGGLTWAFFPTDLPLRDFHFSDPLHGYASSRDYGAGSSDIRYFQTADGGRSWKPIPIISQTVYTSLPVGDVHLSNICGDTITFYPPEKVILFFGHTYDAADQPQSFVQLSVSPDLGHSWRDLKLPLPAGPITDGFIEMRALQFFDASHGLLAVSVRHGNDDTPHAPCELVFYVTQDGGLSWSPQAQLANPATADVFWGFDNVRAVSPADFLARDDAGTLRVTHNGGRTWKTVPVPGEIRSPLAPSDSWNASFLDAARIDLTTDPDPGPSASYQTADDGATWQNLSQPPDPLGSSPAP